MSLTLCLFQEKEEGKKVKGWKHDGKKVFPLFGTTKNDEGKKPAAGAHTKNLFLPYVDGKFGRTKFFYMK
jgi:hypothetical protein